MARSRSIVAAATAGVASWSLLEYALHRFVMHVARGRGMASVEHLKHHADVTYYAPASKKLASAAATTAIAYPSARVLVGRRNAAAYTLGLIGMYFVYEVAHRRTHTHPPRGRYSAFTRRLHMQHHFGAPMRNFGVTTALWDKVFATFDEPRIVTVPTRMAPLWLIDEHGQIRPEYAAHYTVRGPRATDGERTKRDRADAFANLAPEVV